MRSFRSILLLVALVMAGSCVMEDPVVPSVGDTPIEFSASKMRVITKVGDKADPFDEGTKFRLFAVEDANDTHNWSNAVMYNRSGEMSSGMVSYGDKVSYGVEPLNILDFYGVTYGTSSDITVSGNLGVIPKVSVEPQTGSLPDLMYSDNLKSKTSASGLLQMEFRHAMSKLNIEILKQDESADQDKKLENAVLEKIVLKGTGVSGTFNIEAGSWEDVSQDADGVTVFSGSKKISTAAERVVSDQLAIPVTNGNVSLEVYLSGIDGAKANPITYTLTIGKDSGGNDMYLNLEQNHEYTLSVAVLKNDVRIVTVTPKVYEWIDVELDTGDAYFGQPVYFGGLMWMDRNLGAKSADCENDWYNTVGHYYQFGRNIPFILDVEKWLAYTEDDGEKDMQKARIIREKTDRITWLHPDWNSYSDEKKASMLKNMVDCIYSNDHRGERVSGYKIVTGTDDILLRNVGDVILDSDGNVDDAKTTSAYVFGAGGSGDYKSVWTYKNNSAQNYWNSPDLQPCPKGWRLPTQEDLYTFMPRNQVNWASNKYPTVMNNPPYENVRFGYVDSPEGRYNVCYILKNPGTSNAYRLMIKSHFAKNIDREGYSKNKRYISIARFAASADDTIGDYTSDSYAASLEAGSKENTMWSNPVEVAYFPGCGYIVPDKDYVDFRSFGWGTIMRTSDYYGTTNNWVQYLSVTDYQLSIQNASRRSLGDQIRCVRDVNAK